MLRIEVANSSETARRLRALNSGVPNTGAPNTGAPNTGVPNTGGLVAVAEVTRPGLAALVLGSGPGADVALDADLGALWAERILPFARYAAGQQRFRVGPPVLHEHDPGWLTAAARLLDRLRAGLGQAGLDDGTWTYDHIGSTSVPGLAAKPFLDLQLGVTELPAAGSPADDVLGQAGFLPEPGARPDSPGVYRDAVTNPAAARPAAMYAKRLYLRPDPPLPAVLHVRLLGAQWWAGTRSFRDRLRASPQVRRGYEDAKRQAAAAHATDADFDDYTRAKGEFFRRLAAGL